MESYQGTTRLGAGSKKRECPQCGDSRVTASQHRHTFTYGSEESAVELRVDVPLLRCTTCGFQYLDEEAEQLKHEAVCRHFGVLPPGEIRRIREHHQMSRARFAEVTGLGEASLNRWENGLTIQTQGNDRYIRLLAQPGVMQHLEDLARRSYLRAAPSAGENRFRTLEVTEDLRREQDCFRLRSAA